MKELSVLFVQILMIAREMGVFKLGKVGLDGSKMKGNASRHRALSSTAMPANLEAQLKPSVPM